MAQTSRRLSHSDQAMTAVYRGKPETGKINGFGWNRTFKYYENLKAC